MLRSTSKLFNVEPAFLRAAVTLGNEGWFGLEGDLKDHLTPARVPQGVLLEEVLAFYLSSKKGESAVNITLSDLDMGTWLFPVVGLQSVVDIRCF